MPINAQIPLGVQPMQIQQQDPNSQMNALARVMQVGGMMDEQKLNALKVDEYKRNLADQESLRNDLAAPGADPYNALLKRGRLKEANDFAQGQATTKKTETDQRKSELEMGLKKAEHAASLFTLAKDPQSYAVVRAMVKQQFGQDLPEQFDPNFVQGQIAMGQTITQKLAAEHQRMTLAETSRHNTTTEGLTLRGQNVTQAEGAANRGVTLQGQKLTDARARDFNATKVEENNIKRDEKKATADLTKNSQVASFDTMLGTLDRLSKHPGLSRSVGVMGSMPTMPGSDSANFQAELNTFQSQAFLPMVAQLKGMGALSDAEGKKLTAAVGALDPKMGEVAFRDSVERITKDMEAARQRVSGEPTAPRTPPAGNDKGPKKIANDSDYNALPSGAVFVGPDGKQRRKP